MKKCDKCNSGKRLKYPEFRIDEVMPEFVEAKMIDCDKCSGRGLVNEDTAKLIKNYEFYKGFYCSNCGVKITRMAVLELKLYEPPSIMEVGCGVHRLMDHISGYGQEELIKKYDTAKFGKCPKCDVQFVDIDDDWYQGHKRNIERYYG